jgi:ATP-dependent exoDNAse (exonuclease V) beta subunit
MRAGVEVAVMRVDLQEEVERISEGVVDLLTRSDAGYQVVDWKTDDEGLEDRREKYESQVRQYTGILRALGQEMEEGRIVHLGGV